MLKAKVEKMNKDAEIVFRVKASPFFWRQKAEELKYTAEKIWPHAEKRFEKILTVIKKNLELDLKDIEPDTFPVCMALLGFSIECLFKAVIIRNNPEFVSNGKLSKKLRSHNLTELAKIGNIRLTNNEKIFCKQASRRMSEYRYPVPLEVSQENHIHVFGGNFKEVFDELYDKLYPTVGQFGRWKKNNPPVINKEHN